MRDPFAGGYRWSYPNRMGIHVQRSHGVWFGGGWFGSGTFDPFHYRAVERWDRRKHATRVHDPHRLHNAQRAHDTLKPHEVTRKMSPDQKPVQSSEAPMSLDPRPQGHDDATPSEPLINRLPEDVQAAPPPATESKAGQTVGMAPVDHPAAEAAQVTPPPMIEHEGAPTTRSLDGLSIVMAMAIVALGLIQFLFRPTYTKRILAFGAMRRSQPEDVRPVDLSWQPLNQSETDPGTASGLTSVKKVLDTIKEVETEMAFSSPGRHHEADPSEGDAGLANERAGDERLDARAAG